MTGLISNHPLFTRRKFLAQTSAVAASALFPLSLSAQQSVAPQIPSRDTSLKFNPDGTRRPFAGNTVICHLPVQCAMRDRMVDFHEALAQSSFRHKLGLTSTDSYHMTVFPGANDQDRSVTGWPSYVPTDASIEVCNRMVGEHMAKAHLSCELPIRVCIDQAATANHSTALSLRLVPVSPEENSKLRAVRDRLSELYGFRLKSHDTYQFHMTMSYQMAPFTSEEQAAYRQLLGSHLIRITEAAPVLELGNPEYCTFPDMFRFDTQKLIACS